MAGYRRSGSKAQGNLKTFRIEKHHVWKAKNKHLIYLNLNDSKKASIWARKMQKMFNDAETEKDKLKVKRAMVSAANKAGVIGRKTDITPEESVEALKTEHIYRNMAGNMLIIKYNPKSTYWEDKGQFKSQYEQIWEKYVESVGMNTTDNKGANAAIKALIKASKRYYRYYNDGDPIPSIGAYKYNWDTPKARQAVEEYMSKAIIKAWVATQHGKVSVVGYEPDIHGNMSTKEKAFQREMWTRRKTMSKKDFEHWNQKRINSQWKTSVLQADLAKYKEAIANKTKDLDLKYMKEQIPIIEEILAERAN